MVPLHVGQAQIQVTITLDQTMQHLDQWLSGLAFLSVSAADAAVGLQTIISLEIEQLIFWQPC